MQVGRPTLHRHCATTDDVMEGIANDKDIKNCRCIRQLQAIADIQEGGQQRERERVFSPR